MGKMMHADVTWEILGAAFEVHNQLGTGFLEKIYEKALVQELRLRGIACEQQVQVPVTYKGLLVGDHVLDLLVEGKVVVELKAVKDWANVHTSITLSYLAATKLPVALILNFGKQSLEHKRIVR